MDWDLPYNSELSLARPSCVQYSVTVQVALTGREGGCGREGWSAMAAAAAAAAGAASSVAAAALDSRSVAASEPEL
eukprot:COSAG05_NODE_16747_length_339_cov_1.500000_1_plen_75_part_10